MLRCAMIFPIIFAASAAAYGAEPGAFVRVYMNQARVLKLDRPVAKAIADERILVSTDEGNTVRVYRQTERTVLSCTPSCEPPGN